MSTRRCLSGAALIALLGAQAAPAMALDANFRGSYICEQMATTRDILRVPARLVVDRRAVRLTRPLLDLDGHRIGIEVARGSIDRNGALRLSSRWSLLGNVAHGDYRGTLGPGGGTLTGTQTWTGPGGGDPVVRGCTVALVRDAAASWN
jgi:hypothetical protein